ncbi:hypothetical protein AMS68_006107 [Peltaster fructicola]|uniref:fructose-bisphosphatase n=1 Tax=Peltaster fructicola TaxID=286661 RepID=A0A6H0Y1R2_9PEZI|nr:hypothetical protein AMS68_006107 [Peltaster fructicola]
MSSSLASSYGEVSRLIQSVEGIDKYSTLSTSIIPTLISCVDQIGKALRSAHQVSLVGTANAFGDDQLNVDVIAEDIIRIEAAKCSSIATISSEEDPVEKTVEHNAEDLYTLAFDPLDGSSIIAPNWTVGTVIGIWTGSTALHQAPSQQIAAVLGVYGPRTTAIIAIRPPGCNGICFEIGLKDTDGNASCEIIRDRVTLAMPPFKTRYFAPANLRAAAEDEAYMSLVNHYIKEKYTLRYSGGLVPDVLHILVKRHGIYVSPVTKVSKAKLRSLYELAPIALIVECAGGEAIDPATGTAILQTVIQDCDQRAGLVCGTASEIEIVEKFLGLQRARHLERS